MTPKARSSPAAAIRARRSSPRPRRASFGVVARGSGADIPAIPGIIGTLPGRPYPVALAAGNRTERRGWHWPRPRSRAETRSVPAPCGRRRLIDQHGRLEWLVAWVLARKARLHD